MSNKEEVENVEEKIAVHCRTEDEWDMVVSTLGSILMGPYLWDSSRLGICISTDGSGYGNIRIQTEDGYKIISAQEYLNKGGKNVSEFQIGDRVKCINSQGSLVTGDIYTILHIDNPWISVKEIRGGDNTFNKDRFKLTTKTQTTKENDMKENNIDSNVLAIFGSKVKGDELVVIDRHFTPDMLQRILMEKHHKDIQAECILAETERLEKEDKDNK